jgi:uncharacterized protein (DUF58 family)
LASDRELTTQLDWGRLAPLHLRARTVAEGVYAGAHRSRRRGPGVEFGGHREYVPGDDLRWIDRHALMRHDRLMVREFETETDRALHLLVDATASMSYRGTRGPGAKVAFAALIAAALARIALASGDPVSLSWVGGAGARPVGPTSGSEAFERVVRALSEISATGDAKLGPQAFERTLALIARRARRGSVIVLLSDLIDLPHDSRGQFAALGTAGDAVVETEPALTRARYVAAMDNNTSDWSESLAARGGRLVRAATDADPIEVVRLVLRAVAEGTS